MNRTTKSDLLRNLKLKGACQKGLAIVDEVFEDLPDDFSWEWSEWTQGIILADPELRRFWGWAVSEGILPAWSMACANLSGADLLEADLRRADLRCADLSGANLGGANLAWADLTGAKLYGKLK